MFYYNIDTHAKYAYLRRFYKLKYLHKGDFEDMIMERETGMTNYEDPNKPDVQTGLHMHEVIGNFDDDCPFDFQIFTKNNKKFYEPFELEKLEDNEVIDCFKDIVKQRGKKFENCFIKRGELYHDESEQT